MPPALLFLCKAVWAVMSCMKEAVLCHACDHGKWKHGGGFINGCSSFCCPSFSGFIFMTPGVCTSVTS